MNILTECTRKASSRLHLNYVNDLQLKQFCIFLYHSSCYVNRVPLSLNRPQQQCWRNTSNAHITYSLFTNEISLLDVIDVLQSILLKKQVHLIPPSVLWKTGFKPAYWNLLYKALMSNIVQEIKNVFFNDEWLIDCAATLTRISGRMDGLVNRPIFG